MKRSTPLRRVTPLTARPGLARTSPTRQARPAVPQDVRAALTLRSGGICEVQLHGCTWWAMDPQHRITQKQGGRHGEAKTRHDRLSNLLHCCRTCHDWITGAGEAAYEGGWSLREWQDPAREPVQTRYFDLPAYLTDDGRVLPFEAAGP